jgi:hypothetical protein
MDDFLVVVESAKGVFDVAEPELKQPFVAEPIRVTYNLSPLCMRPEQMTMSRAPPFEWITTFRSSCGCMMTAEQAKQDHALICSQNIWTPECVRWAYLRLKGENHPHSM